MKKKTTVRSVPDGSDNHFKMGGNLHIFFSGGKNAAGEGSGSGGPSGALNALELFWVLSTE